MRPIDATFQKPARPEKIIQFGEGRFLRGFADWMLQKLCDSNLFCGSVVVVQPTPRGVCQKLNAQNCLYTHVIRGVEGVETQVVDVISRGIDPYTDYDLYLALADDPGFRFILSNTTEAGIVYREEIRTAGQPLESFPAKLTDLLYRRFQKGLPGFILLPCELIEQNGSRLRELVLRHAADWNLGEDFSRWIREENHFLNTLVDRIVTGDPGDLALDYTDAFANASEFFHLWVIEGNSALAEELPFHKIGLNVIWTDDLERYRTRKVRILNGAHTSMVAKGLLEGFETVRSCMEDPAMSAFLRQCVFEEILPTLSLPRQELESYAEDVLRRFSNPYIHHRLADISLNSVSKFRVRVLPSLLAYRERFGKAPQGLVQAFGCLIRFYKEGTPRDDEEIIARMRVMSVREILSNTDWWGTDCSFLTEEVAAYAAGSQR